MRNCALAVAAGATALLLSLGFMGSGAGAQDTHAMSILDAVDDGRSAFPKDATALRRIHAYGRCVGSSEPASLLSDYPASAGDLRTLSGTARFSSCGGDNLRFPRRALRGIMAEYLFERHMDADGKLKHTPAKVFRSPTTSELERMPPEVKASIVFVEIATCVGRANLPGVRQLLATPVATPEERAAFAALVPSIGNCVPAGVDLRMHRMMFRGFLAEGAYRAAATTADGAS